MCNLSCILFGAKNLTKEEVWGKKVIEIGSYDWNGSLRSFIESLEPAEYVGVDIEKGPGVNVICDAENIVERFGEQSFDVVLSTELIEHIKDWRKAISSIKNICKPSGTILITTRSYGFRYHPYPYDFWRYELEDMKNIFSDCEILVSEKDFIEPGAFIKVKKPYKFVERDLSDYELYSIVANKRVKEIQNKEFHSPYFIGLISRQKLRSFIMKIGKPIFYKLGA